jgi:hypothetical protein
MIFETIITVKYQVYEKTGYFRCFYLQEPLVLKANQMGFETYCFTWDNRDALVK